MVLTHLEATERHLPYGIGITVLPVTQYSWTRAA